MTPGANDLFNAFGGGTSAVALVLVLLALVILLRAI